MFSSFEEKLVLKNFLTRMLLPTSLLILLSVAASAEEARTCYWCGPLAEQVHRSQRAPACDQQLVPTTCDAGYSHCATVATSPPYAESRLCVKFYQDECYSLYCNSSKTWRMICPCQGHLCNGQNTDRETTAFATLAKIEGKHKRSKRSLNTKGFLSQRKKVTVGLPEEQTTDSAITDSTITDFDTVETTTTMSNDVMEENAKNIEDNIVPQGGENEMQGDQPTEEQIESNEVAFTAIDEIVVATEDRKSETTKIINMDTEMVSTISEQRIEQDKVLISTSQVEVVKETDSVPEDMPKLTSLPATIELELSVVHVKEPNNMPPPEALQQTVTSAKVETTTTHTTMGTIETSTNDNHMESIQTTAHSIKEILHINEITKNTGEKLNQTKNNGAGKTNVSVWGVLVMQVVYITL